MTYGAEIWGPAVIQAGANIIGSTLSKGGNQETKTQRRSRKTIDEILASLNGDGKYSDLFEANDEAFQKGFVDPARSKFQNQTAPQIQQQYIASGMQNGTGVQDSLTRAGVDMDTLLNQQYYQFQQDALTRKANALNGIIGAGSGAPNQQSTGEAALQATGGYLRSDDFDDNLQKLFKEFNKKPEDASPDRKGFEVT